MGSNITEEELEELTRNMDGVIIIKTIKICGGLFITGFILYNLFY